MAQRKEEAWLTSAVENASVESAMVLAESIRKTKTTRTIAVITCRNIGIENGVALRKAFDAVFYIDDSYISAVGPNKCHEEIHAKIYAFSLQFFKRCVYLSPNSLLLENADKLFEDNAHIKALKGKKDDFIGLSLFMFKPGKRMWDRLWASLNQNGKSMKMGRIET